MSKANGYDPSQEEKQREPSAFWLMSPSEDNDITSERNDERKTEMGNNE